MADANDTTATNKETPVVSEQLEEKTSKNKPKNIRLINSYPLYRRQYIGYDPNTGRVWTYYRPMDWRLITMITYVDTTIRF
jgi:energy-converting hydrogenase Eha subunit F